VACFPAAKRLPNGQNAHCTVRPAGWWRTLVEKVALKHPGVLYEFRLSMPEGDRRVEKVLTNAQSWAASNTART
jgi:hypothetical protein